MRYNWRPLFFSFLIPSLFGNEQLVSGGRIPFRKDVIKRENTTVDMVEVPGLGVLAEYVCPKSANVRRQTSGATTIAVPKDHLENVLLQLQQMELAIIILINEYMMDGQLDSTDPSTVYVGEGGAQVVSISSPSPTSMDLGSLNSAVGSVLSAMPAISSAAMNVSGEACTYNISTTTLQSTITVTAPIVTETGFSNATNAAASSTAIGSATASTLTNTSTSSTAIGSASASSTLTNTAASSTAISPTSASSTLTNTAASSTAIGSAAASSILTNAAASSTTTADSGPASSSNPPDSAAASSTATGNSGAPASTPAGGIFIQTSAGSQAASTTSYSGAAPTSTDSAAVPTSSGANNPATGNNSTAGYLFNAQSTKNVAVYFGQTAATGGTTLTAQCADPNIDIVILAFVISTANGGEYPEVDFGAACSGQTAEMISKAPGLLSCPQLASDITTCQSTYGKKVLLSLGGATSQISFLSSASASTFATTMWNLFGPPGNVDIGLRPFGTAQIDGFDVDNEDQNDANWATFASTLRTHYPTASKTYYLSSAPQCPFPDASNPVTLLLLCDFVWVQFYNNPQCQIGGTDFAASLQQWSTALSASTLPVKTRLYLGAPAFSAAGSTAYAAIGGAEGMEGIAKSVEDMGLSNFGGVMFWDGPEGMLNTAGGKDILAWAKAGLSS